MLVVRVIRWPLLLGSLLLGSLLLSLVSGAAAQATPPDPTPAQTDPLAVLHQWDQQREAAYVAGDSAKLADLYATGSTAAAADLAILESYRERGLRVQQVAQQFFSVRVVRAGPTLIALRTIERFAGGLALGEGRCLRIPGGFPAQRLITLTYDGARWRVESVSR